MPASLRKPYAILLSALAVGFFWLLPAKLGFEEQLAIALLGALFASAVLVALDHPAARLVFGVSAIVGLGAIGFMALIGGLLLSMDRTTALADGWGWYLPVMALSAVYLAAGFFIVPSAAQRRKDGLPEALGIDSPR